MATAATVATAVFGTPTIDGTDNATWASAAPLQITGSSPISASAKFMWDAKYLYILADVSDDTPCTTPSPAYRGQFQGNTPLGEDNVEAWLNWTNSGTASYAGATGTMVAVCRGGLVGSTANSSGDEIAGVKSAVTSNDSGYTVTMAIPWPTSVTRPGSPVGIVMTAEDYTNCDGLRSSYITSDNTDSYWLTPDGIPALRMQGGDNGTIFESTSFAVTQGKTAYLPVWSDLANGDVTYSTSNASVAAVNSATGQVAFQFSMPAPFPAANKAISLRAATDGLDAMWVQTGNADPTVPTVNTPPVQETTNRTGYLRNPPPPPQTT